MYWFKVKEVCRRDTEKLYVLPPGFRTRSITFCPGYVKVTYASVEYPTLEEMIEKFHQVMLRTGQSPPIVNFYQDGRYLSNGEKLYKDYVLSNKNCI